MKRIDFSYGYTHPGLADGKDNGLYLPEEKKVSLELLASYGGRTSTTEENNIKKECKKAVE